MRFRGLGAGALLLAVAACDAPAPQPDGAAAAPEIGIASAQPASSEAGRRVRWVFPLSVGPDLPEHEVTLEGEIAHEAATIHRVAIRRSDTSAQIQEIDDLGTSPPLDALETGRAFERIDMNFDGYGDFRIMELAPAGPNVLWSHWLYSPDSGSFVRWRELDALTAPSFDPGARQITSTERSGAARTVTETFDLSEGRLVLTRRAVKEYTAPGSYRLTVSEPIDGRMQVTEVKTVPGVQDAS